MDLARDAEEAAGQLDELVAPAGEPGNAVLASVCVWLSFHTQQLAERRLVLLLRRGRKTGGRAGAGSIYAVTRRRLPERAPAGCPASG